MKQTKPYAALIAAMKAGRIDSKKQQDYLFKLLNNGNDPRKEVLEDLLEEGMLSLSDEQVSQGLKWLRNLWLTPAGKERKNNPFGYREQQVLEHVDRIWLSGYWLHHGWYRNPVYRVVNMDGYGFEYHVFGGQIHITG